MTQTTSGYANVNGGKLYYESAGEGRTLVLGHAGLCDHRQWDSQWDAFAHEFRVIRYDLRGYGESDPVTTPVSRRADLKALFDALGLEQAAVLGCSISGGIAVDFTLDNPDRVWALIPFSATPSGFQFQGQPPKLMGELSEAMQAGNVDSALEVANHIWLSGPQREVSALDPALVELVTDMDRRPIAEGVAFRNDMKPVDPLTPPAIDRLGEIKAPTLVMAGALDDAELVRAADVMASGIPGAAKYIMPHGAHLANMEQPDEFNRAVLEFLRGA